MLDGRLQFVGLESKRSGPAFIGNTARGVDHIEPIGPGRVCTLGRVAEFVEDGRDLDSQFPDACSGNERALVFAVGTGEDHFLFYVAFHLPDVARVRLGNVDHEECDLVAVLFVEFVEGGNLPPERRSSVASEHEDDWLLLGSERRQLN